MRIEPVIPSPASGPPVPLTREELEYFKEHCNDFPCPTDVCIRNFGIQQKLEKSLNDKERKAYKSAFLEMKEGKATNAKRYKDLQNVMSVLEDKLLSTAPESMVKVEKTRAKSVKQNDISGKRVVLTGEDGVITAKKGRVEKAGFTMAKGCEHIQLEPSFPMFVQWDDGSSKSAPRGLLTLLCETCDKVSVHKCGRCKNAHYCSRECQKVAWKEHKKVCGK